MAWDIDSPRNIEIFLDYPDDFKKIRETLTRIGAPSSYEKKLYQSCHILHKRGRYFIVHFKEMFMLDGRPSSFSRDDMLRRNTIAHLLSNWGLLKLRRELEPREILNIKNSNLKIVKNSEKRDWKLIAKYKIGVK